MMRFVPCGIVLLVAIAALAAESGDSVVVVYNQNLPESRQLAEYYARRRAVPASQLFGVDVNEAEIISRADFNARLRSPLFDWLVEQKLFTPATQKRPSEPGVEYHSLVAAKIRYLVLCYGVPLKIARDASMKEKVPENLQEALRGRNEAAVDADLALLPMTRENLPLTGLLPNPFYLTTNAASLQPTNGIVLVARLDGPTVDIARGLVDKALQAETNGLWGRAYFDARGITNGDYKLGDDWMRASAAITRRMGFDTVLDVKDATFPASFPMSQIAFYAGWYDLDVSGPFALPTVEFMPGAFAYHLHSFSANTMRSTDHNWVGPLLAKGVTITFGTVDEPYLMGTPNVAAFLDRLIRGRASFGEAAYISQASLSWQTTVVGDPLYRPFAQTPDALHYKLDREKNPLIAWSHLRVVNLNEATSLPAADSLNYLKQIPVTKESAILMEKVGDLERSEKHLSAAAEAYAAAVKLNPSPMQKIRLLLAVGQLQTLLAREEDAFEAYKQLVTDAPDYPDAGALCQKLASLARQLGKSEEAAQFAKQAAQSANPK